MKAAVIGYPIEQSKSPNIHNLAYEVLGLGDWHYTKVAVTPENIEDFFKNIDEQWAGISVTMPLKTEVFAYADEIDALAKRTNAINCMTFKNGKVFAYNTDVYGIVQALKAHTDAVNDANTGVIFGSGATARSAFWALKTLGIDDITVTSRTHHDWIGEVGAHWLPLEDFTNSELMRENVTFKDKKVLTISTLPWGPAGEKLPQIFAKNPELWDIAALECAFPKVLEQSIDGSVMLIWQAIRQIELMTSVKFDENALFERLNTLKF